MLGHEEYAFHVDCEHLIPIGFFNFFGGYVRAGDARVVDQDIQLAEFFNDLGKHVRAFLFHGDVQMPVFGLTALLTNQRYGFHTVFVVNIRDSNLCAFAGEHHGFCTAQAAAGAGNDGNLT